MNVSNNSSNEVYYSDDDIELQSISEDESDIELSTFITNPIKDTDKSLKNYNVKELTKDLILNSLQEDNKKLEQDKSYRFWGTVAFCAGNSLLALTLIIIPISIIIFSNPIGWIIGGVTIALVGIGGLGYFLYSMSKRLSVEEKATTEQEKEKLSTLLNLLNDNEDFKKILDSYWYEAPFTLDQLMDFAQPFLPLTKN